MKGVRGYIFHIISIFIFIITGFTPHITWAFANTADGYIYEENPTATPLITQSTLDNLSTTLPYLSGSFINVINSQEGLTSHSLSDRTTTLNFLYDSSSIEFGEVMAYSHANQYRNYIDSLAIGFDEINGVRVV